MDLKVLIGILNRPWLIEPVAAQQWADVAARVLYHGAAFTAPQTDKRGLFTSYKDLGATFRVDASGAVNEEGVVQVLKIEGPVAKQDFCGSPGALSLTQMLQAANADDSISAILLWIDSPGGQVDGTENFATAIRNSAKPVVSFSDYMMCSAAYWHACSATEIIIDGSNNGWNAKIGSIGTMSAWWDDSEKMAKEGVKLVTVFADASKDKWGDFFAQQKGDYTRLKQELNGINDSFLAAVKANRAGKIDIAQENVLSGKVYNANEALQYGLIDTIGSFTDAVARAVALSKVTQKKTTTMSAKNHAFQQALTAAKTTDFTVVEGGFLLTEDHLNAIDARLDEQATTASATAAHLKTLQAQAADFAKHEQTAAALATANTALATAQEKITALEAQVAEQAKKPGALFQTAPATGANDPGDETEDDDYEKLASEMSHNKKADALWT